MGWLHMVSPLQSALQHRTSAPGSLKAGCIPLLGCDEPPYYCAIATGLFTPVLSIETWCQVACLWLTKCWNKCRHATMSNQVARHKLFILHNRVPRDVSSQSGCRRDHEGRIAFICDTVEMHSHAMAATEHQL